jgi:RNA polymerase sigma factor (sigma-70 family)
MEAEGVTVTAGSPAVTAGSPDHAVDRGRWVLEAVDRFEVRLLRFAARLLCDEEAARDAVQHAFLRLCGQSVERLNGRVGPWLFAVCRHYAIDVLRKREAAMPCDDAEVVGCCDEELDPALAAERADLYRSLSRLVDQLPLPQREALSLWSEGFGYQQIAEMTDTSEGNVRVIVHRALKRLREHAIVQKMIECQ